MKTFKEMLAEDIDVFVNPEEFAESHEIDGRKVLCVLDNDESKTRSNRERGQYDGIYKTCIVIFVKEAEMGYRPVFGQAMTVNGVMGLVESCKAEGGMLEIRLGVNES